MRVGVVQRMNTPRSPPRSDSDPKPPPSRSNRANALADRELRGKRLGQRHCALVAVLGLRLLGRQCDPLIIERSLRPVSRSVRTRPKKQLQALREPTQGLKPRTPSLRVASETVMLGPHSQIAS
jgi:hypothetical protein